MENKVLLSDIVFLLLNDHYSPNYIWILYIIVFLWYDMKAMIKKLRFQKIEYKF